MSSGEGVSDIETYLWVERLLSQLGLIFCNFVVVFSY